MSHSCRIIQFELVIQEVFCHIFFFHDSLLQSHLSNNAFIIDLRNLFVSLPSKIVPVQSR